jgi:acyl carrier protein
VRLRGGIIQFERQNMSDLKQQIREFIIENFLFGDANGLKDDTSFLDEGIMDSTGALELVTFLEEEFSITVEDEELIPENLDSVNNVTAYLEKKM